jgi:hypothetical protein
MGVNLSMPISSRRINISFGGRLPIAAAASAFAMLMGAATLRAQKSVAPAVLRTPTGVTEVGTLDGAPYRIDVPASWNHSLVVFYHGYALRPYTYHLAAHLDGQQKPFYDRHYAVIESAYSRSGWALEQAYPETEALRRYFVKKYGQPKETYAAGGSMGGELTAITLELNPKAYVGGLDLCGAVGPTYAAFDRRFALRAAFDVYFPDVMPPLVPVPANFEDTTADRDKVLAALRANPTAATTLRNLTGLHSDADVAHDIAYWTFVVGDMQQRAGGNPFDNRNLIYAGTGGATAGDLELNERVKRYAASPKARAYLVRHYTPSGRLERPMLALHTIYDPIVQVGQLALYNQIVEAAGYGDNLVQQYVDREGHCNFTEDEIGGAFDELVKWTHGGPRPVAGLRH